MNQDSILTEGNINNPAIIFIHGFPFDHRMWEHQTAALNKEFYCVTYDLRGLGEKPTDDFQFTIDNLADDVIELCGSQNLYKPVICGLSMGGYIALRTVEKDENLFRGVILCDTKSEADNNQNKVKRADAINKINKEGVPSFVEGFIANCFSEMFVQNSQLEYNSIVERSKRFKAEGIKACLLAMAARTDTTEYLEKLRLPALLICGSEDKLTPPAVMKEAADKIKNSEYHIIEDAGHMSPIESPERVNYLIKAFLHKVNS